VFFAWLGGSSENWPLSPSRAQNPILIFLLVNGCEQVLTDTHPKVQTAAQTALQQVLACPCTTFSSRNQDDHFYCIITYANQFYVDTILTPFQRDLRNWQVGSVIRNPEIAALVPTLLLSIADPNEHTKTSLDLLLQVWVFYTMLNIHVCLYVALAAAFLGIYRLWAICWIESVWWQWGVLLSLWSVWFVCKATLHVGV
jgi:hypothetical protein